MTPRVIYYINYIDPVTGFLRREEYTEHRRLDDRIRELRAAGVKYITEGKFETP
jgi:hypothetical protein